MVTTIYQTSNTDLQTIEVFSLGDLQAVEYDITISTNTDVCTTTVSVSHDGVTTSEAQHGTSFSGNAPLLFTTDISNYAGRLRTQPAKANSILQVTKKTTPTTLYGETTQSGRLIRANTGIGYDNDSSLLSICVREANNNSYTAPTTFLTSNTLGPIDTKDHLLLNHTFADTSYWRPFNDSVLTVEDNQAFISSFNTQDNYYFQEIPVVPGRVYRVEGSGYSTSGGQVRVGETVEVPFLSYSLPTTAQSFEVTFTPNTSTVFVSFGHANTEGSTVLTSVSCRQSVPFHTYEQEEGTFYIKWSAVAAGNNLFTLTSTDGYARSVAINAANSVTVSENNQIVIIGTQAATNRLALSYGNNTITASLNGNAVVSNNVSNIVKRINSQAFTSLPLEFSYSPFVFSNTLLVEMSTNV